MGAPRVYSSLSWYKMPKVVNLNTKLPRKMTRLSSVSNVVVDFCPKRMVRTLCTQIKTSKRVVGCVAWLTHPSILQALESVDSAVIMTRHKSNRWSKRIQSKMVGAGRGRRASLMHHKFLVGCDAEGPLWVSFGSFNMTTSALSNLENMTTVHDRRLARVFCDEYERVDRLR